MLNINNMKVGSRLGLGFGILIVFSIVIAAMSWKQLADNYEAIALLANDRAVKVIQVYDIKTGVNAQGEAIRTIALIKGDAVVVAVVEHLTIQRLGQHPQVADHQRLEQQFWLFWMLSSFCQQRYRK